MSTTRDTAHATARELLAVYAIGNVDADQERVVESHVARCSECHAELQSLLRAADELAFSAQQLPMPSHLRASILDAVDGEVERRAPSPARSPGQALRRRFSLARTRAGVAVPVAACMVLAFSVATLQTVRLSERDRTVDELRRATTNSRVESPNTMVGTSHVMPISATGPLKGSTLELVDVHGAGLIVTKDLPEPPAGYEWHIWGVTATHDMHPMGELAPRAEDGMGVQPVVGLHAEPLEAVAITLRRVDSAKRDGHGTVVGWAQMA